MQRLSLPLLTTVGGMFEALQVIKKYREKPEITEGQAVY